MTQASNQYTIRAYYADGKLAGEYLADGKSQANRLAKWLRLHPEMVRVESVCTCTSGVHDGLCMKGCKAVEVVA